LVHRVGNYRERVHREAPAIMGFVLDSSQNGVVNCTEFRLRTRGCEDRDRLSAAAKKRVMPPA
jgi:hypothetical protein